jgi:O-antigen/teichoic acid export membrane protein/2-polyprenyl-3-methyl-5-hydroxy-6-metoxy-1,4-benzoquinol methylase
MASDFKKQPAAVSADSRESISMGQVPPDGAVVEASPSLAAKERVRIMSDGVLNNVSLIASGVIGIALVPIMLKGLGSDSYGIWIAALSVLGTASLFDFGLGMCTTREVARSCESNAEDETKRFIQSAGNLFLVIGLIGGMVIAAFGLPLSNGLHLSAQNRPIAIAVFVLAGISFLADRLLAFATAVLRGLRRFDFINLIATSGAILRAAGIVILIRSGSGAVVIMLWQAAALATSALASLWLVYRLQDGLRFRLFYLEWNLVRSRIAFSLASQLVTIFEVLIWDIAPIVVGLVLGAKWIVPYYVAQQFPTSVGPIIWATADALLPSASQSGNETDFTRTREILQLGTRWVVVIALPLCLGLWVVGPKLLQAWLGTVPAGSVLILRLVTLAVFMEGFSAASIQVLWGQAKIRALVILPVCLLIVSLGLTLLLLPRLGVVGAAWGLVVPMIVASLIYIRIGASTCGISLWSLIRDALATLMLPAFVLFAVCFGVDILTGTGWIPVIAASVAAGSAYLICFILLGAREEELMAVHNAMETVRAFVRRAYWNVRHLLARVRILRSTYYLLLSLREAMLDSPERGKAELNHEFESREDPWDYAAVPFQVERILREVSILDSVRPSSRFQNALEIGCAEGLFTEKLAPICNTLLAVDISGVALHRTQTRLAGQDHVQFALLDLRIDPIPDSYDLIVIIHALEYIRNPIDVRRIRTKLVNSLRPGGYLFIGTMEVAEIYENAWWGRFMLRSGQQINRFFAAHPALKTVRTDKLHLGEHYVAYDILLQKQT